MNCPRPVCNHDTCSVLRTHGPNSVDLPLYLRGMNAIRRRRKCEKCGWAFWTAEILEDELMKTHLGPVYSGKVRA